MARPTKSDIERSLLSGKAITWTDTTKGKASLVLVTPKERRLFSFLLNSNVREARDLPQDFLDGLWAACSGSDDPADTTTAAASVASGYGPWRLQSIESEGFGGVNTWGGQMFRYNFDQDSLLVEGPNGSGKSSLVGAILWAISGERPRDQSDNKGHEPKPVFSESNLIAGDWPPIACYPPAAADLRSSPYVRVQLTFQDPGGNVAKLERVLSGGKLTVSVPPNFDVPSILLEAGLLMPARLGTLRLNDGNDRLTDAVQKLTGLDDLVAIGSLVEGLCNKGREYLSYEKKPLASHVRDFDQAIEDARDVLTPVSIDVPEFTPAHTNAADGDMAKFGKMLIHRSAELTKVISDDLATSLDLKRLATQNQVNSAIAIAQEDLEYGLDKSASWKALEVIGQALDDKSIEQISGAVGEARKRVKEAVHLLERSNQDSKFQLKAVAAHWHSQHGTDEIRNCTLCDHDLEENGTLVQELEALRSAGSAATRQFDDNLRGILADLDKAIPPAVRKIATTDLLSLEPRSKVTEELRRAFANSPKYASTLVKFVVLVESALNNVPAGELMTRVASFQDDDLKDLNERIAVMERLIELHDWFRTRASEWRAWWQPLVVTGLQSSASQDFRSDEDAIVDNDLPESLSSHLLRLSDALGEAAPYQRGAELVRKAWVSGKEAAKIQKELKRREEVAESLRALKSLSALAQAIARDAIDGLSDRIGRILERVLITEQLRFHSAQLKRREGLIVRGGFDSKLHVDATLIANTSWLRAVLWAFLFSLREEAVEQFGADLFPLLVLDDPQATFDNEHRHRWAQYLALLQSGPSKVQIILTTHDEMFLELVKIDGVKGRQAMIATPSAELGFIGVFEGESLTRKWNETRKINTPSAGRDYMAAVRVYVEGMLRLMLKGEDAAVSTFVVGESRDKIEHLNSSGVEPWNRSEFANLANALGKHVSAIKHIEIAHHASGNQLGMAEATDVEKHWRGKLRLVLERGFRLIRDHQSMHGGLKALHAAPPTALIPDGFMDQVRAIRLKILGRAAALTDGRIADGRIDLDQFASNRHKKITLAQHYAYRLTARTLEPVARPGDVLIVKDAGDPSAKSLVLALHDDRILARRFEVADNHSDVAVLTAHAINPRQIAPPVVAKKATLILHKVVGVLYDDSAWNFQSVPDMEICKCNGAASFASLAANTLGLVEVVGDSAEPYALNKQYLIVKDELTAQEAIRSLDGKPVIASDTDDNRYFKRLRVMGNVQVVLESLDTGGDHGPIVLRIGEGKDCLQKVWPVAGVLFELPA